MKTIQEILKTYDVDIGRGFLPTENPLIKLPTYYEEWEDLSGNLTAYINAGIIRKKIDELLLIDCSELKTPAELERAMLLLSFFAHTYVHAPPKSKNYIPASIAIPWVNVAKKLNRKPILSHSSAVLNNWRLLDINRPIELNNLATLCQFHGGLDESWFYLVTVEIEQVGAKAISLVLQAIEYVKEQKYEETAEYLNRVSLVLAAMILSLKKMYECCDPHIFYLRVRPFLSSFEQIEYRGTGLAVQSHHGGSAAQSSLLQFFDAAFGISYENKSTEKYLRLMRYHMPSSHAAFLTYIENTTTIRHHISKNKALKEAYQKCLNQLVEFRNEHLKIVALYIIKPAKQSQSSAIGTGGTNPMFFLKSVRDQGEKVLED